MYDILAFQHSKCHGKSDTVVSAKRSASRLHPFVLHIGLNGCVQRVVHAHAHHVHVVQQHDGLCSFMSRRGGFADDDAVLCIALVRQVQSFCKLAEIVCHTFFVV